MQIADLEALSNVAMRVDRNPVSLAARAFGLSPAEVRAGIPAWGWVGAGLAAGVLAGYFLRGSKMLRRITGEE